MFANMRVECVVGLQYVETDLAPLSRCLPSCVLRVPWRDDRCNCCVLVVLLLKQLEALFCDSVSPSSRGRAYLRHVWL